MVRVMMCIALHDASVACVHVVNLFALVIFSCCWDNASQLISLINCEHKVKFIVH